MMSSYKEHLDLNGFDDEEDLSDDEVFTRGGKSISLEENGVSKPLMAPRQRNRDTLQTKVRKAPPVQVIWAPIVYALIALGTVIGIICLVVFLINIFMKNMSRSGNLSLSSEKQNWIPCTKITTEDVWARSFPMLTTESSLRLNDINSDGIEDIIIGFGTGADAFYYPSVVCDVYFNGVKDCGGGIMALDGRSGKEIWRHYSAHEIFAINCNVDLDNDNIKDCVGSGRMAGFFALRGNNGTLLWEFNDTTAKVESSNVYTPQYVRDLDFDGISDIVVVHGGDPMKEPGSNTRLIGRLLVVSGKSGRILKWVEVPDKKESYYSPQILTHSDGTEIVLFGTGGETHGGSLWYIKLSDLLKGKINKATAIYTDKKKGIMTPPVLADITGDGILDIVMAMFNSTVVAFNGLTFEQMWKFHQPSSESYSTPGVGYFNNDSVPDFIINYQIGPGFPIYYYTQTTVLDGRNGHPLLDKPIQMVVGTQSSPLVISVSDLGNDIFLYWVSDCHGSRNESKLEFDFLEGTSVHEQSRADFCKLRFKEKLFTRMYAMSSHTGPPGYVVYDSDNKKDIEYSNPVNYSALGLKFLYDHPKYWKEYYRFIPRDDNQLLDDNGSGENLSEMQNQFDALKLKKYLNDRIANSKEYSFVKSPFLSDQNEYNIPDDQAEEAIYPPYYSRQKYNFKGDQYTPLEYYIASGKDNANENIGYLHGARKLSPKSTEKWADVYAKYAQPGSWMKNNLRNTRTKDEILQSLKPESPVNDRGYKGNFQNVGWKKTSRNSGLDVKPFYQNGRLRYVRHVGPHDNGGIQRVISTGTLAPALNSDDGHGIDVIFATFWFFPSTIQALMPGDKECILAHLDQEEERFKPSSSFYGMDHDAYLDAITKGCLRNSNQVGTENDESYTITDEYNPFDRPMGQLTVYRMHIKCKCSPSNVTSKHYCTKILPFEQQGWTSYMGKYGNCVAIPRFTL